MLSHPNTQRVLHLPRATPDYLYLKTRFRPPCSSGRQNHRSRLQNGGNGWPSQSPLPVVVLDIF